MQNKKEKTPNEQTSLLLVKLLKLQKKCRFIAKQHQQAEADLRQALNVIVMRNNEISKLKGKNFNTNFN